MTRTMGNAMIKMRGRALMLSTAAFAIFAPLSAHAQDAADLMLRIDRLEAENRRLTGQVEELRFKEQKLEDQFKRFQMDADSRFRELEGGKGGTAGGGASTPRVIPTTPPAGNRRSDAFDPNQTAPTPGAPRPLGGGGPVAGGNPSLDPGAPRDLSVNGGNPSNAGPGTDATSNFTHARGLIERGEYENGEVAMRDFQKKYARDKRAPEATFWIGESYLRRTRYREAAESFLTVTTKHSGIAKAPEAMLKLGISLRGLGANAEACGTFDQVSKKYPNASAAIKSAVEREKSRAKCS